MLPQKCRIIKASVVFVTNYIAFLKIYRVLSHTALFFLWLFQLLDDLVHAHPGIYPARKKEMFSTAILQLYVSVALFLNDSKNNLQLDC